MDKQEIKPCIDKGVFSVITTMYPVANFKKPATHHMDSKVKIPVIQNSPNK